MTMVSVLRYTLILFLLIVFLTGIYLIFMPATKPVTLSTNTPPVTIQVSASPTPSSIQEPEEANDQEPDEDEDEDEDEDKDQELYVEEENDEVEKDQDQEVEDPDQEADPSLEKDPEHGTTDPSQCPDLLIRQGNTLLLYNSKMPEKVGENPIKFNSLDDYIYYIKVQRYTKNQYCPVLFLQQETNAQSQDVYRIRPSPFHQEAGLPTSEGALSPIANFFAGKNLGGVHPPFLMPNGPTPFNQAGAAAVSLGNPGSTLNVLKQGLTNPPKLVPYVDAAHQEPYNKGYYGFDPTSQYIGKYTILDAVHSSTQTQFPKTGLSINPMDPNWGGIITMPPALGSTSPSAFTPMNI